MRYPEDKKQFFAEFPPLAERRIVQPSEYGTFTKQLVKDHNLRPNRSEKLITDLHEKRHFLIHFTTLKQALQLGVELVELHRAVRCA